MEFLFLLLLLLGPMIGIGLGYEFFYRRRYENYSNFLNSTAMLKMTVSVDVPCDIEKVFSDLDEFAIKNNINITPDFSGYMH